MERLLKFFQSLAVLILGLLGSQSLHAHTKGNLNLQLIMSLEEQAFSTKLWVPASAIPELANIKSEEDLPKLEEIKSRLETYLDKTCPLKIDGISVKPILKKLYFEVGEDYDTDEEPSHELLQNEEKFQTYVKESYTPHFMTEMEWFYPIKVAPDKVSIQWGIYLIDEPEDEAKSLNPDKGEVLILPQKKKVMALFKEYKKIKLLGFSESEPEYIWHRAAKPRQNLGKPIPKQEIEKVTLNIAAISMCLWALIILILAKIKTLSWKLASILFLVGMGGGAISWKHANMEVQAFWKSSPKLSEEEAIKIFLALHNNIYRAFDYENEDDIYDVLEQSVDGALLDDLYEDIYQSLILRDEGGAVCKVNEVRIKSKTYLAPKDDSNPGFRIQCSWEVEGFVQHWEHIHRRVNAYKAIYTLLPSESTWKIAAIEVSEHRRLGEDEEEGN